MSKSPSQPSGDGVKTEPDMSGQQQVPQQQVSQNGTANAQQSGGNHSAQELDHIVAQYLQKKGYTQTEAMLRREAASKTIPLSEMSNRFRPQDDPSLSDHVLFYSEAEAGNPDAYDISYKSLRGWIENSLDWYKPELRSVLFPIFVHSYLDLISKKLYEQAKHFMDTYKHDHLELHTPDINRLATITNESHVQENELAQIYRQNKYIMRMSSVPFELFLNYLQDNKFMLLLRIVNQYLNIQVAHGKLRKSKGTIESDDVIGIVGHPAQQLDAFNEQEIQLGKMQTDSNFKDEVDQALKEEDAKRAGGDVAMNGETTPSLFDTYKKVQQEIPDGPAFGDVPMPPYRGTDIHAEVQAIKDIQKRLALNSTSLPSVCCYTFHNTHDSLNCITMSEDTSLIAGGFSESYVKIWSLKGEKLRSLKNNITPAKVNDYADLNVQKERHGSPVKRLVGHSGPVYGLSFSHDNKYLLSCSEDKTARLWNTVTYTNLVVYKGHNYPVWDVEFGPYGFYFATASHDRTARLWSCDHIHPLRIFAGHLSDVDTVKFHPNSKYLVTGSSDRTARLWDVQRGASVRVFAGHQGAVKTVAVSPDGKLMASAGEDKTVMLWDLGSGKKLKTMTGHTDFIYTLDFSSDGNVLVSGSADCTVRVWDVKRDTPYALSVQDIDGVDRANATSDSLAKRMKLDKDSKINGKDKSAKKEDKAKDGDDGKKSVTESKDQLASFATKQTPIYKIQFTKRNLCLAAGAFTPVSRD
ncbi:Transcription initiation factor TFIID subunit 5 [Umbelopsis nana]